MRARSSRGARTWQTVPVPDSTARYTKPSSAIPATASGKVGASP